MWLSLRNVVICSKYRSEILHRLAHTFTEPSSINTVREKAVEGRVRSMGLGRRMWDPAPGQPLGWSPDCTVALGEYPPREVKRELC